MNHCFNGFTTHENQFIIGLSSSKRNGTFPSNPPSVFWSDPTRAEKWLSFERFLYVMQHYSIARLKFISLNLFNVYPIKITRMGGGSSVFVHLSMLSIFDTP
jgi:hypothetical protein